MMIAWRQIHPLAISLQQKRVPHGRRRLPAAQASRRAALPSSCAGCHLLPGVPPPLRVLQPKCLPADGMPHWWVGEMPHLQEQNCVSEMCCCKKGLHLQPTPHYTAL